jgi:membrane-associated protease RseP (regulator of RpoE activity)
VKGNERETQPSASRDYFEEAKIWASAIFVFLFGWPRQTAVNVVLFLILAAAGIGIASFVQMMGWTGR